MKLTKKWLKEHNACEDGFICERLILEDVDGKKRALRIQRAVVDFLEKTTEYCWDDLRDYLAVGGYYDCDFADEAGSLIRGLRDFLRDTEFFEEASNFFEKFDSE
jgi:hypothetical protein